MRPPFGHCWAWLKSNFLPHPLHVEGSLRGASPNLSERLSRNSSLARTVPLRVLGNNRCPSLFGPHHVTRGISVLSIAQRLEGRETAQRLSLAHQSSCLFDVACVPNCIEVRAGDQGGRHGLGALQACPITVLGSLRRVGKIQAGLSNR